MASDQLNKIFCVPYIHYNILMHQIDYFLHIQHAPAWLSVALQVSALYKVTGDLGLGPVLV